MIGELWIGRGEFDRASGIARGTYDREWSTVRFLVFEPIRIACDLGPYAVQVEQEICRGPEHLEARLNAVIAAGGEGLVLRHARFDTCAKVKPELDDDAIVCGHLPGKGRNAGRLGALLVRLANGRQFRLGGGLSDTERDSPPPIGTMVRFVYEGLTSTGLPRFARYRGTRAEAGFPLRC